MAEADDKDTSLKGWGGGGFKATGTGGAGAGAGAGTGGGFSSKGKGGVGAGARASFGGGGFKGGAGASGGVGASAKGSLGFGGSGGGSGGAKAGAFGSLDSGVGWSKSAMASLHKMNAQDRQLVGGIAGSLQKNYGMSLPDAIVGGSQLAKTIFGELGKKWGTPENAAAVAQVALNRLGLANTTGAYGGDMTGVLGGFDASGYDQARVAGAGIPAQGNSAFQSAMPGTTGYQTGLDALQGQLAGTGPPLPAGVVNATNYRAGSMAKPPGWERGVETTPFGPHAFSNPDPGRPAGVVAANNQQIASFGGQPGPTVMASLGQGIGPPGSAQATANPVYSDASAGTGTSLDSGASAMASPSYPDAQQGSWYGNLAGMLGSGFESIKTYGSSYLDKARSPENIAEFARSNPLGAMRLAGAFGSLDGGMGPRHAGEGGGLRTAMNDRSWFQKPKGAEQKSSEKKPKDRRKTKTRQEPPKWVFPALLTRPYTLI